MTETTPQAPVEKEIDLGRMFGMLVEHKWLIICLTAVAAMYGIAYGMLATPVYRADALVQVERRSNVSPLGDLSNVLGVAGDSNTSAEVQILQSRMVLGQAVDRVGRDTIIEPVTLPIIGEYIVRRGIPRPDFPITLPIIGDYVLRSGIPEPDFMERMPYIWGGESIEVARFEMAERRRGQSITVERSNNDRYRILIDDEPIGEGVVGSVSTFLDGELELRIQSFNAPPGAQFKLIKRNRDVAVRSLGGRLMISEAAGNGAANGVLRLSLVGTDMREIVRSLDAVADTFLTQNVERQSAQADQSLEFLQDQAPELQSQLSAAEARLNQYRAELDSVDLSSEASATIERYIDIDRRLNELEFQEEELRQRFTYRHPSYQALLRQKEHLRDERVALNERVNELPAAQQEVVRRTRDVEVTQAIYVNVLNKIQELQVAKAGTIGNVRIIDRAMISGMVAPNRSRILIVATLLGLVLSVGLVLLRELMRRGVTSPEQIESAGIPVYASIPLSSAQARLSKRVRRKGLRQAKSVMTGILAECDPADLSVEAIRGLRTSLHFALLEGCNNRIMITGSSPGVGKSFLSINLASVFAQAGKAVVLVDADLRKGYLHRAFKLGASLGLSDYLAGQCDLDDIIRPTGIENYHVISRGRVAPNPSELLMQSRLVAAMESLSERFDLVLVDTPPVLAVTDASVVGKLCDTNLLVARFEKNPVGEIKAARRRLEDSGIHVRGAVLNAVELNPSTAGGYYGHYQYQYR